MDLACHTLDFLDYLLGPISSAVGAASNQGGFYPAEDIVSASFRFQSGIHGTGVWCFTSYAPQDRVELTGSRGKIRFASFSNDPIVLTTASGSQEFQIEHPAHVQQPLIQQIVNQLLGSGQCVSTGESAVRTTRVMEQILG